MHPPRRAKQRAIQAIAMSKEIEQTDRVVNEYKKSSSKSKQSEGPKPRRTTIQKNEHGERGRFRTKTFRQRKRQRRKSKCSKNEEAHFARSLSVIFPKAPAQDYSLINDPELSSSIKSQLKRQMRKQAREVHSNEPMAFSLLSRTIPVV